MDSPAIQPPSEHEVIREFIRGIVREELNARAATPTPRTYNEQDRILVLSEYEWVNLRAALQSGQLGALRSPLEALNSGDWLGQLIMKLGPIQPGELKPNKDPLMFADGANALAIAIQARKGGRG